MQTLLRLILNVTLTAAVLFLLPFLFGASALKMANATFDAPFCIEVATGSSGYSDVSGAPVFVLSPLTATRDEHGLHSRFHAVLFVETPATNSWSGPAYHRFNWSFLNWRWEHIRDQGHAGLADKPECRR